MLVTMFLLGASIGVAAPQTAATLDLATVSPADDRVTQVYGASGDGATGVPVTGGSDCDGDAWPDYAVAFFTADPFGRNDAGEVDLVFGQGTIGGVVDTAVTQPGVLRIAGAGTRETAGSEIWIDDVTGDGLGDLLIGRQNYTFEDTRIGAGALTIIAGSPLLRSYAADLEIVDLAAPPEALALTTLVGANALDRLGIWMRTGDVTGDGIADIVVGADQEDLAGEENRGAVYLIRGGSHLAGGGVVDLRSFGELPLDVHITKIIPPPAAASYHLGATCQIGDLDGNGRSEVLVAAALARAGATIPAHGAPPDSAEALGGAPHGTLYVVWDDNFPAGGWPRGFTIDLSRPPGTLTTIHGAAENRFFGEEILAGSDYDGDRHADLFVGDILGDASPAQDRERSGIGYVFYRAEDLKGLVVDLEDPPLNVGLTKILGPSPGALGGDTAAHGDFDGDGFGDLAFASPKASPQDRRSAGAVHVLFGQQGGWPGLLDTSLARSTGLGAVRALEIQGATGSRNGGPGGDSDLGDTLAYSAAASDVNLDGFTDLIVNEMLGNGTSPEAIDVGNMLIISGAAIEEAVSAEACAAGPTVLCLGQDRFRVEVGWRDFAGNLGSGRVVPFQSADSGLFWFFESDNWEILVKVLDGCGVNDHFWVFASATTNVEFTLTVIDTANGTIREYFNSLGRAAHPIADTEAFFCP